MRRLLSAVSAVLIALVAVLTPLSVLAVWAEREIGDTDGYVTAMAPLAGDAAVRGAVADRITDEVMGQVDAGPLTGGVRDLVREAVVSFAGTEAYRTAWDTVNRAAHTAVEQSLTSDEGDTASIDLAPVSEQVKRQLSLEGVPLADQIPVVGTSITVVESGRLGAAREVFDALQVAGVWLPAGTLLVAAVALPLARRKARALTGLGLAFAAGGALLFLTVLLGRAPALADLPPDVDHRAAGAVFDALTTTLRQASGWLVALGLALALTALRAHRRDETRSPVPALPPGPGEEPPGPEARIASEKEEEWAAVEEEARSAEGSLRYGEEPPGSAGDPGPAQPVRPARPTGDASPTSR
ncbi:hypothetical protein [Streptomyces sp. NPDC014894]|uniref:hypothetical protein n=1 Tax=unclassified Streptomyces TaxID=2593676 RepID=UPI0036F67815